MSENTVKTASPPSVEALPKEEDKFITHELIKVPSTGETIRLEKLKAGKHYEAQKLYVDWMQDLQSIFVSKAGISPEKLKEFVKEDGSPDMEKIEEEVASGTTAKLDTVDMLRKIDGASAKRLEFLAVCLSIPLEELNEKYYPEDLDVLISGVIKLNNFMDNLKKSVAPSAGLGA